MATSIKNSYDKLNKLQDKYNHYSRAFLGSNNRNSAHYMRQMMKIKKQYTSESNRLFKEGK